MSDNSTKNSRINNFHGKNAKKKTWLKVLRWVGVTIVTLFVLLVGLFAFYAKDAPNITTDALQSGGSSGLYAKNGELIISLGSDEQRNYVKNSDIPQSLKDAVVSVEDRRFYSNPLGIDPIRIVTSVFGNVQAGGINSGASTITQQLVKLTVFDTTSAQQTLRRKAQEAWLAMKIEQKYSKDQILEYYINKVYMNYGVTGMQTGAKYYYNKSLNELTLPQIALIAGMPNAPTSFDPYKYPERAKSRRDTVLAAMLKNKKITQAQYDEAVQTPIKDGIVAQKPTETSAKRKMYDPYIKEVINDLKAKGYDPYKSNLKITVNMDKNAQEYLYNIVNNGSIGFTNDKMQVGATIVDPDTGGVVAMIGGRNLPDVQLGLNRAVQTSRSSGSTIKPVLDYAPAIEYKSWSTYQQLNDTRYVYPGTNIQLYDWDSSYLGTMSMRRALVESRNVPAVRTLEAVGLSKAREFVSKMGISIPDSAGLSVGIGADVSSLQLAAAYAAFANGGYYNKPSYVSKVESPDGTVKEFESTKKQVMKDSTAYMITDMLKGVFNNVVGSNAKVPNIYEAGKTGTVKYSDDELKKYPSYDGTPKDAWFSGYTKQYAMSIWTGFDQISDGTIQSGGEYASQQLYKQMMTYLMKNKASKDWTKPNSAVRMNIISGTNPPVAAPPYSYYSTSELFVKGTEPDNPYANAESSNSYYDNSYSNNYNQYNNYGSNYGNGYGNTYGNNSQSSSTQTPETGTGTDENTGGTGTDETGTGDPNTNNVVN